MGTQKKQNRNASRQENQRLSSSEALFAAKVTLSTANASATSENVKTARSNAVSLVTPAKPPVKVGSGIPVKEMLPTGVDPAKSSIVVAAGTEISARRAYP